MNEEQILIVRCGDVAVKGMNKPYFERMLAERIKRRLEKAGYVTRERSKEDERITVISITCEGEKLKEKCKDIPGKLASAGSALTEKDARELYRLLYLFLNDK